MALNSAHEGYEYQDLLSTYFILQDIIDEHESQFKIDIKEYSNDKFDDLTIINKNGTFKKQVKYSNSENNHTLKKDDLSTDSYELAIDALFVSWSNHSDKDNLHLRLCVTWNEPTDDEFKSILYESQAKRSFDEVNTKIYQIDGDQFWPIDKQPHKSWQRFNRKSKDIDRNEFIKFLNQFIIEIYFPRLSQDIHNAGELERIVLNQIVKLGIGIFPNNNWTKEAFALSLIALVKQKRSSGKTITTQEIFNYFNIQTDYGSIKQEFPIIPSQNIKPQAYANYIAEQLEIKNRIILTGEPGGGKSWFVENIKEQLNSNGIHVIRHLCYTDLEDAFQKDRIKLDVFYGNLIKDILDRFPTLKNKKTKKFASDLNELNHLLCNITEKTVLIIDGIDHIDRIYDFKNYKYDLAKKDIDIINKINEIQTSEFVKILIVSQPISDLHIIQGFANEILPKWTILEIEEYMAKTNVDNIKLEDDYTLSHFLLDKSTGNPLYLKYLIDEIKRSKGITLKTLNQLPNYSENLTEYYQYLLSKLNLREQLPRILSGVHFSLTKEELKTITGDGDYIDEDLKRIQPVIKLNISQSGYSIYHESFKRFILEKLKLQHVSIEKTIFNPIIEWFETIGFFKNQKGFRFYLPFLYDLNRIESVIDYVQKDFITKSIYHGYSLALIKHNYQYMLKAVLRKQDFPKIIIANELNKILNSTQDIFDEQFNIYLETLGYVHGFKHVSNYLSFEGEPTLELQKGLNACYLCHMHGVAAPWDLYIKKIKNPPIEIFKSFVNYCLIFKKDEDLSFTATQISNPNRIKHKIIFKYELLNFEDQNYIESLKQNSDEIRALLVPNQARESNKKINITKLAAEIFTLESVYNDSKIDFFLDAVETGAPTATELRKIYKQFENINWFRNWVIFAIKIKILKQNRNGESTEIKKAFSLLTQDTKPFKGKPRVCDLYSIQSLIHNSLKEGLSLLKVKEDWIQVIDILEKLSDETTVSIKKSLAGPLATDAFYQILYEYNNDINRDYIITVLEKELLARENHHLHSYLAEYCFHLSKLYAISGKKHLAEQKFEQGVKYLFGYTTRKDLTIEDLTESIISINSIDNQLGSEYIKKIKPLIDAVVDHTDGKDTAHFPNEWFNKYIEVDFKASSLYLRYEFLQTRIDWRLEKSLLDLLEKANGNVNHVVELLLCSTFPIENSTDHLFYALKLVELVRLIDFNLAKRFFISIYEKSNHKKNTDYPASFYDLLNELLKKFQLENELEYKVTENKDTAIIDPKNRRTIRKKFSEMNIQELTTFISENKITEKDVKLFANIFGSLNITYDQYKDLIKAFFSKTHVYDSDKVDATILFENQGAITIYYWVSRYVNDQDGWYKSLVNIEAFKNAYKIDNQITIQVLCELLFEKLQFGSPRVLTANLLNGLVKVNFDTNIVKNTWHNLFDAISYRLPYTESYDWNKALENNLEMNQEEIFICLLFARFKPNTTERYEWTLLGITYLLFNEPNKMIKPIKWFLQNKERFIDCVVLSVIELIFEFNKVQVGYANHFKSELESIYPTKYFLMDAMIESLFSKNKRIVISSQFHFDYPINSSHSNFLYQSNPRHKKIDDWGIDIFNIFGKFALTIVQKYDEEFLDIYANRIHKRYIRNLYHSNYLLELINTDLYADLYKIGNSNKVIDELKIDIKLVAAQMSSNNNRPKNLIRASQLQTEFEKREIDSIGKQWIRIGYYENELFEGDSRRDELKNYKIFGGIHFETPVRQKFPFCQYPLESQTIWDNASEVPIDSHLINYMILHNDTLESHKILWLNPNLIAKLGLKPIHFLKGLAAENKNGELVLKYNCWRCDYVNYGDFSSMNDEIPKLEGCELLMRRDIFEKVCSLFVNKPAYYILKVIPTIRNT